MTKVFIFTNYKGGVGKSTSATNIALDISIVLKSSGAANLTKGMVSTLNYGLN